MFYNILFGFYEKTTDYLKEKINNYFYNKPEKGLVESNFFLLGEHVFFFTLGMIFFGREDWLYDLNLMWYSKISWKVIIYYYLYITRYVVQTKQLQKNNKEYYTYLCHHISTISLLSLSFFRQSKIGIIIAIVHDIGDIFLLPAKICHRFYETRDLKILNTVSYALFIMFIFIFSYTRIYQNGYIVYFLKNSKIFSNFNSIESFTENFDFIICTYFLFFNLCIQMLWELMIFNFLYCIIFKTNPVDEKNNIYKIKN